MPGMAAGPSIFDNLQLDPRQFNVHKLEWFPPTKGISLDEYALEMTKKMRHERPILLGVSFGGLLVQEMAKWIPVEKTIIVSSVKSHGELPKRMRLAKYTGIHKLLPTSAVNNVEILAKYAFGDAIKKRLHLYEKYLAIRDKDYLDWAIDAIVRWEQEKPADKLVHIHGEKDAVFPIHNITDCIRVKNGTHTMIIHRSKWFNEHLPDILLSD